MVANKTLFSRLKQKSDIKFWVAVKSKTYDFTQECVMCREKYVLFIKSLQISKVGDCSRGWPEDSLFNSYYTEV